MVFNLTTVNQRGGGAVSGLPELDKFNMHYELKGK